MSSKYEKQLNAVCRVFTDNMDQLYKAILEYEKFFLPFFCFIPADCVRSGASEARQLLLRYRKLNKKILVDSLTNNNGKKSFAIILKMQFGPIWQQFLGKAISIFNTTYHEPYKAIWYSEYSVKP